MEDCRANVEVAFGGLLDACGGRRQGLLDRSATFPSVRRESGNIDKRRDLWIVAGFRDDGPAVAVAHQNHRTGLLVDGGLRELDVLGIGRLWLPRYCHRVPVLGEDVIDGFPTGAVGECAV